MHFDTDFYATISAVTDTNELKIGPIIGLKQHTNPTMSNYNSNEQIYSKLTLGTIHGNINERYCDIG